MVSPVFDGVCVEFMEVCLIQCHLLHPPLLIVWSIFSACMYVFLCGWVLMCVCACECLVRCLKWDIILLVVCCLFFVSWFN